VNEGEANALPGSVKKHPGTNELRALSSPVTLRPALQVKTDGFVSVTFKSESSSFTTVMGCLSSGLSAQLSRREEVKKHV